MEQKNIHRAFGFLSFILALAVYTLTVQPTVPFWDCAEFSAAAIWQQVPHPPGTPLFLLVGKLFHLIIPFGDPGWKINMVSVLSSAITVLLLYLITVKVIKALRTEPIRSAGDALAVYGSSFIAAATLTFSDTFWFNAVESEVYAMSSLFVALVVFLMMKWFEEADNPGHERYLLLIAYLLGLSTGVHLLSILAVFSIVLLVYFRKYEFSWKSFFIMGLIAMVIFGIIYPGIVKWLPAFLAGHTPGRNAAREYTIEDEALLTYLALAIIFGAVALFVWGLKNKKQLLNLILGSFLLILLGYTTYTQILLRSNANPPMNENEPKDFTTLASYLGREQYGDAPSWPRRYQASDEYIARNYTAQNDRGEYVYGEWYPPIRVDVQRKDGSYVSVPEFDRINFAGEINYLWKYQIDHMYLRYLGWNFIGRTSDVQDAGVAWFTQTREGEALNYNNGYKDQFPVTFFALPLIFGLIGLLFHFYKDDKMALVYLIMFLLMGVLTAIVQNQQQPQPRERDYFYAGSFFVFCMWIGMGAYALIKSINREKIMAGTAIAVIAVSALAVPLNMAAGGWKIHSRAGNYLPFDYSYNILQSCEENAILFTNGDNDTFPLWYLQDVMGVRRDVRVANLSLGNTLWYVDQLKNRQPWGAEKIPLSFPDEMLHVDENDERALSYDFGEAREVRIPVRREILAQYTDDPSIIESGEVRFTFHGKPYQEREGKMIYLFRVQDKLILDILEQTRFERPVYFSNTVGPDAHGGLDPLFRYEGMAARICPVKQRTGPAESIHKDIMDQCLMNTDNSHNFSTGPQYGFKFRNLNNPDVYYDEVHRRLMGTYRHMYLSYADYLIKMEEDRERAVTVIDKMNEMISPTQFPMTFDFLYRLSMLYDEAGDKEKLEKYARLGIDDCKEITENPDIQPEMRFYEATAKYFGPYRMGAELNKMIGEYEEARIMLQELITVTEGYKESLRNQPGREEDLQKLEYNLYDIYYNIDDLKITKIENELGPRAAIDTARALSEQYLRRGDRILNQYMQMRIAELQKRTDTATADKTEKPVIGN
ncbi:MAG: protein O-mannosyl-transferase family [Candidatus Kapaibacterium sp.]